MPEGCPFLRPERFTLGLGIRRRRRVRNPSVNRSGGGKQAYPTTRLITPIPLRSAARSRRSSGRPPAKSPRPPGGDVLSSPLFGTISLTVNGTGPGPTTGKDCTSQFYIIDRPALVHRPDLDPAHDGPVVGRHGRHRPRGGLLVLAGDHPAL